MEVVSNPAVEVLKPDLTFVAKRFILNWGRHL
jgi:hypothetical protein